MVIYNIYNTIHIPPVLILIFFNYVSNTQTGAQVFFNIHKSRLFTPENSNVTAERPLGDAREQFCFGEGF